MVAKRSKDICIDGLSCGLACISKDKECLKNLSKASSETVKDFLKVIRGVKGKSKEIAGAIGGDKKDTKTINKIDKSVSDIINFIRARGEKEKESVSKTLDGLVRALDEQVRLSGDKKNFHDKSRARNTNAAEVAALRKNKDFLIGLDKDIQEQLELHDTDTPEGFKAVSDFMKNKYKGTLYIGEDIPREITDKMYELLPKSFKSYFSNTAGSAGSAKKLHALDQDENGVPLSQRRENTGKNTRNTEGAKALFNIYSRQGGLDYSTGVPLEIESMELEHIVGLNSLNSLSRDKRDSYWNLRFINRGVNGWKSDSQMKQWLDDKVSSDDEVARRKAKRDKTEKKFSSIQGKTAPFLDKDKTGIDTYRDNVTARRETLSLFRGDKDAQDKLFKDKGLRIEGKRDKDAVAKKQAQDDFLERVNKPDDDPDSLTDKEVKQLFTRVFPTAPDSADFLRRIDGHRSALAAGIDPKTGEKPRSSGTIKPAAAKTYWANYLLADKKQRKKLQKAWNTAYQKESDRGDRVRDKFLPRRMSENILEELKKLDFVDLDI